MKAREHNSRVEITSQVTIIPEDGEWPDGLSPIRKYLSTDVRPVELRTRASRVWDENGNRTTFEHKLGEVRLTKSGTPFKNDLYFTTISTYRGAPPLPEWLQTAVDHATAVTTMLIDDAARGLLSVADEKTERTRDLALRRTFGITLEEYKSILAAQGHTCPVCLKPLSGISNPVDHSHKTGVGSTSQPPSSHTVLN